MIVYINSNHLLRFLGFVVVQININHIPKATAKPIQGLLIDRAAKKPTVAMIQVIKNQTIFFIVYQIYVFNTEKELHRKIIPM